MQFDTLDTCREKFRETGKNKNNKMSKRNLRRLKKKEKDYYLEKFSAVENNLSATSVPAGYINHLETTEAEIEVNEGRSENREKARSPSVSEKLKQWCIKHRVSRNCAKDLIEILRSENLDVRPFYKFHCQKKPVVENICGGSYIHIGLQAQLKKMCSVIELPKNIMLDINIDGLPLFNSSRTQLWPILLRVSNVCSRPVFPVGIFVGKSKPSSCDEFLQKVVEEFSFYMENGLEIDGDLYTIEIRAVLCDAPARAFITGTPSHTSCHGCSKCIQVGKKINGVLTYSVKSGTLISDEDFKLRKFPKHHSYAYSTSETAL